MDIVNDPLHLKAYGTKNDYSQKHQVHYPQLKDGKVDEWKALIDQRLRKHEFDQKMLSEIKRIDQNQYKTELDVLKSTLDQQKVNERVVKQHELMENNERMKVLQEYNQLKRNEDQELKNYLSSTNKQILSESHQRKQDETYKNLQEDLERNKRLRITNDEEQKRKLLEKQEHIETQNKFLEYRQKLKEVEKNDIKQKHLEYIWQCEENGKLQDQKDKMYKQFFADFEQNLNQKAKMYLEKLLEEEIKKDMMMRNWETNGNDPVFRQMSEERIRQEVERRLKDVSEIKEFNKFMIEQHEKDKERQHEILKLELEVRKKRNQQIIEEDEFKKQEGKQNQRMYGDTLSFQNDIHRKLKHNYGSMTEQEKKMNKLDLKSYKQGENTLHSMIPGISNIQSVGATPLMRKGVNLQLSQPITISTASGGTMNILGTSVQNGQTMGELLNQSISSARGLTSSGLHRNASSGAIMNLSQKMSPYDKHPIKESIINKRVNTHLDADLELMRQSFDQKKQMTVGYYNPITNPVPNYSQNPYIARERNKAHQMMSSQSKPLLAMAGNNILM